MSRDIPLQRSDKDRIEELLQLPNPGDRTSDWPACHICSSAFGRSRPTLRYCRNCEKAYCEGEHGGFGKGSLCLACMLKSTWGTPLG